MKKKGRAQKTGKSIEEVASVASKRTQADWFGSMKDTFEIVGDIISPASDEDEWEVLRD
jgi:hypothetical protein